jgi:hypothetical protein
MKKFIIICILVLLVISGFSVWFFWMRDNNKPNSSSTNQTELKKATTFKECVEAGYPTAESYPRMCTTANGKSFTEDVSVTSNTTPTGYKSLKGVTIIVTEPLANTIVKSPLTIRGEVQGNWSFEASFPVAITDNSGNVLVQTPAQLKGDWMTDQMVPFEVILQFQVPQGVSTGQLIFKKDNPSGLPANEDSLTIPVRF